MRTIKLLLLVFLALLAKGGFSLPLAASALWAADFEFRGAIEPTDDTSRLLAYYVNRFAPEELSLSVVGQPDAKGRFHDLFMDLKGVRIEDVRIDRLTFRMNDVQFNAPENWVSGDVECRDTKKAYAKIKKSVEETERPSILRWLLLIRYRVYFVYALKYNLKIKNLRCL